MLKTSVKLSDKNQTFLSKVSINRVKADMEKKIITPSEALDVIEEYFKLNNNEYINMIHIEVKK